MRRLFTILLLFFCTFVNAQSIVYHGLECDFPNKPSIPAISKFEVTHDMGDGNYYLRITDGIPVFENPSSTFPDFEDEYMTCIGRVGDESGFGDDGVMHEVESINGFANLNNGTLIVTFSTIYQDDIWFDDDFASSGIANTHTKILIFKHNKTRNSFLLKTALTQTGSLYSLLFYDPPSYQQITSIGSPYLVTPAKEVEFLIQP